MTTAPSFEAPDPQALGQRLNEILVSVGEASLPAELAERFGAYAALLMKWNARMNLTAVRDEEGILRRHFVESIVCARALPPEIRTLLDFGSGAGFPGLPIALCLSKIEVTLAESQGKKIAFLREALRVLGLSANVYGGRVESLVDRFDCVTLRAVDRMGEAVRTKGGPERVFAGKRRRFQAHRRGFYYWASDNLFHVEQVEPTRSLPLVGNAPVSQERHSREALGVCSTWNRLRVEKGDRRHIQVGQPSKSAQL